MYSKFVRGRGVLPGIQRGLCKVSLAACIVLQFAACRPKNDGVPKGIIDQDRMELILTDMHLADALMNQNYPTKGGQDSITWRAKNFRRLILDKYKISPKQFDRSFDYYISHTERLDLMYDHMVTRLNKLQTGIQHDSSHKPLRKPE